LGERLFIIGLDGASWSSMSKWIKDDTLPHLSRLARSGFCGPLKSILPLSTPVCWSSIYTGKNPGKHGVFEFMTQKSNSYELTPVNSSHRKTRDFWEILGDSDLKSIVINAPLTYPVRPFNGTLISGWGTPDNAELYTHPREIRDYLKERIGQFNMQPVRFFSKEHPRDYLEDLERATLDTFKVASELIQEDWDLFFLVFQETDHVQHYFWAFMDENHPQYNPKNKEFRNAILDFFCRIDDYIGTLVDFCDDKTDIMIISDHGMESQHSWIHLNELLRVSGFLEYNKNISTRLKHFLGRLGFDPISVYEIIQRLRLDFLRKSIQSGGQIKPPRFFLSEKDIDWSRTVAYTTSSAGCIFVNQRNREPQGIVESGADYEIQIQKLTDFLTNSQNPKDNTNFFSNIFQKNELFSGPFLNQAPDLVVLPKSGYGVFQDLPIGSHKVLTSSKWRSGDHGIWGTIILSGPRFKNADENKTRTILDIAPTILYLFNMLISRDMDGRVMTELVNDDYKKSHPILFSDSTASEEFQESHLSKNEENEVLRRLRDLGYI
jgi:predicted AlkP superfamily phosphohydrolase/phosphomutase